MKDHTCQKSQACECSPLADEPSEKCPVHGAGPWPVRCEVCGKFLPHTSLGYRLWPIIFDYKGAPMESFGKSTCFQLWTDKNMYAKTYTTATAAARALMLSPDGWVLEEFWGVDSRGVIARDNPVAMKRLWKIVAEEAYP